MIYTCPDCGGVEETTDVCGMCREDTYGVERERILAEGCDCERAQQCEACADAEEEEQR